MRAEETIASQRLAYLRQSRNIQCFNRAMAQAEAQDDITNETIQQLSDLQRALAIPFKVAQPAFPRLSHYREDES